MPPEPTREPAEDPRDPSSEGPGNSAPLAGDDLPPPLPQVPVQPAEEPADLEPQEPAPEGELEQEPEEEPDQEADKEPDQEADQEQEPDEEQEAEQEPEPERQELPPPQVAAAPQFSAEPAIPAPRRLPPWLLGNGRLGNFAFWALLIAFTAYGLWPVWATDLLPVVDGQSHLHLIKLMHEWDTSPLLQKHYTKVKAIVPYLSYYKLVHWVHYLGPIEWANRVVLSACLAALPLSALALLRAAGHSRWLVLGVLPWMLNADFVMGFFNFLMSIPLFLLVLAAHLRLMQRPSWRRAALVVVLLGAMAITHYLLWAIALALLPTLALVFGVRHGWKRALWWPLRDGMLGLPSLGLLLPWFFSYFVFAEGVTTSDQVGGPKAGTLTERLAQGDASSS